MAAVAIPSEAPANQQIDLTTISVSPEDGTGSDEKQGAEELRTVFHDSNDFNVIHKLENEWTLWYTKPSSGQGDNWNDLLKEIITIQSVEQFWGMYNNITPVSDLAMKSDYHLFKNGVRPEWEDVQNKNGGKWSYQYKDRKSVNIDDIWLHVMLAAIGENLENDEDNEVMGVVVNVRRGFFRVGVWTRTTGKAPLKRNGGDGAKSQSTRDTLARIGHEFKRTLGLPQGEMVEFTGHTDSAHVGSQRAKASWSV